MNVKKGDTVKILSGADRGKSGKIIRALPRSNSVVVEGINLKKKAQRPRKMGEKGQILTFAAPINVSKVTKA
ncbi:50S ribosomal protein L24 [Candidatus Nomurabacteria bacterium RIFCSPHIGHO2_01_FULL_39_9]|uniref:Large ribosomal subunit protein uL24 n=1 Tax=Candidatus Nomurabacteria bacterium RIFCSPHIGHO2_01_FULL_39_9 TaxID=1801735 RepID=A0A1F6UVF1_9BACT|nr:MAG: 50S ribosomal protein L24 [Candidatus Nomurabacteria bacterium RIFCSPHIGHO2_01_FULL_39_9]